MARTLSFLFLLIFSFSLAEGQIPSTSTGGSSSNAASGTGTTNTVTKFTGTSTVGNSSITDDGSKVSLGEDTSIGSHALTQSYTNANPGTVVNTLTKLNSSRNVLKTAITDLTNIYGICLSGCGNSGTAQIAFGGQASCVFDGQTVVNDYVGQSSTVAGDCQDEGATEPTGVQVIGRVVSANSGAATNSVIDLFTPDTVNAKTSATHTITFTIAGASGGTITTGALNSFPVAKWACTINNVTVTGNPSGSLTVDIWKLNNAIPTSGAKISASAPATLSSATSNTNSSISGWTTAVSSNDIFGGTIATASTVTSATVQINCQ